jgi:hypothetical protein
MIVAVRVTSTGHRRGAAVVQAYLSYTWAAREPPQQFERRQPGHASPAPSRVMTVELPSVTLMDYKADHIVTVAATCAISLGQHVLCPLRCACGRRGSLAAPVRGGQAGTGYVLRHKVRFKPGAMLTWARKARFALAREASAKAGRSTSRSAPVPSSPGW